MNYAKKHLCSMSAEPEPNLIRVLQVSHCINCKQETRFIDLDFMSYVCSSECRANAWAEYAQTCANLDADVDHHAELV
jgi:hypothetical protein